MAFVEAEETLDLFEYSATEFDDLKEGTPVVQEPEAEAEADGWEIISHDHAGSGRSGRACDYVQVLAEQEAAGGIDDLPKDLVRGCLDRDCDVLFSEECLQHRCSFCRLFFCSRHLTRSPLRGCSLGAWPRQGGARDLGRGGLGPAHAKPGAGRPRCGSGAGRARPAPQPSTLTEAALGPLALVVSGSVWLCRECTAVLLPGAPDEAPASGSAAAGAERSPDAISPLSARRGIDLSALASEVQVLGRQPLRELQRPAEEGESCSKVAARALLQRLLAHLRSCTRAWADAEREWIWRLVDELVAEDLGWITQLIRQADWEREASKIYAKSEEKASPFAELDPRDAVQIMSILGHQAALIVAALDERRLGLFLKRVCEPAGRMKAPELACCLELLLDAAESLGAAAVYAGRQAIVAMLLRAAHAGGRDAEGNLNDETVAFCGELFWALEARATAGEKGLPPPPPPPRIGKSPVAERAAWVSLAMEEFLRGLPAEAELGLLRQRDWVRHLERHELDAAKGDPGPWGGSRAFPLAVWPPKRLCLGALGTPDLASSKNAPLIVRCRCQEGTAGNDQAPAAEHRPRESTRRASREPPRSPALAPVGTSRAPATSSSAGLLLKTDAGMHREQQVGQTLRLLERLIWEDPETIKLLADRDLRPEDVRATYTIAMTGAGTAIVEFVEGASTLREVRENARGRASAQMHPLKYYLGLHNSTRDMEKALARLACTASISAVLSFVAGLGDRHHENFMVTKNGRFLHVDYGHALGSEPVDCVLIHYAIEGGRAIATLQYEDVHETIGPELMRDVFWPLVRAAFRRVRSHAGLLVEMVHTAVMRDVRWGVAGVYETLAGDEYGWHTAKAFVTHRCATVLSEACAERFIHSLLWYCARHERGAQLRDELKGLRLLERSQQAVSRAYSAAVATGLSASSAVAGAAVVAGTSGARALLRRSSMEARGTAAGLVTGVRDLFRDFRIADDADEDA